MAGYRRRPAPAPRGSHSSGRPDLPYDREHARLGRRYVLSRIPLAPALNRAHGQNRDCPRHGQCRSRRRGHRRAGEVRGASESRPQNRAPAGCRGCFAGARTHHHEPTGPHRWPDPPLAAAEPPPVRGLADARRRQPRQHRRPAPTIPGGHRLCRRRDRRSGLVPPIRGHAPSRPRWSCPRPGRRAPGTRPRGGHAPWARHRGTQVGVRRSRSARRRSWRVHHPVHCQRRHG